MEEKLDFTCPLCGGDIDLVGLYSDDECYEETWGCDKCGKFFVVQDNKFVTASSIYNDEQVAKLS